MGVVYVVYDHALREPFAAKTFQDEVFSKNPQTGRRGGGVRSWILAFLPKHYVVMYTDRQ